MLSPQMLRIAPHLKTTPLPPISPRQTSAQTRRATMVVSLRSRPLKSSDIPQFVACCFAAGWPPCVEAHLFYKLVLRHPARSKRSMGLVSSSTCLFHCCFSTVWPPCGETRVHPFWTAVLVPPASKHKQHYMVESINTTSFLPAVSPDK